MLARKNLPRRFSEWNRQWNAPFGPEWLRDVDLHQRFDSRLAPTLGPFAFQFNNSTRCVEYPWAFHIRKIRSGSTILEIGGALSGFQFVLARSGAHVTNVDPFLAYGAATEYPANPEELHAKLNEYFDTDVILQRSTLAEARLKDDWFDRVYCISTIEHLKRSEIQRTLREVRRILKKNGCFIATVDLFLDISPFTRKSRNRWGSNVSIRWLVERSGMRLVYGKRNELLGFPEFAPRRIAANLENFHVGEEYPALAQMLVLQK